MPSTPTTKPTKLADMSSRMLAEASSAATCLQGAAKQDPCTHAATPMHPCTHDAVDLVYPCAHAAGCDMYHGRSLMHPCAYIVAQRCMQPCAEVQTKTQPLTFCFQFISFRVEVMHNAKLGRSPEPPSLFVRGQPRRIRQSLHSLSG